MKLCVIIPVLNQNELAQACITQTYSVQGNEDVEYLVIDNNSNTPFSLLEVSNIPCKIIHLEENIGVYPIFWEALKYTDADVLMYIHSDVVIWEYDWAGKILHAFRNNSDLGLLGFIGSNEIDSMGGRGLGTKSNMQGRTLDYMKTMFADMPMNVADSKTFQKWTGSTAEFHGGRLNDLKLYKSAVIDGCVMIFKRSLLEEIEQRNELPNHHFYDRILSCETMEHGQKVGTLGIAFDHISGQTANTQLKYFNDTSRWFKERDCDTLEKVRDKYNVNLPASWDQANYLVAEKMFLDEYREEKKIIPIKI